MVVRMRETRVLVGGPHDVGILRHGVEYDLPAAFAAYLILERKADYRPGRLRKFSPKEMAAPKEKRRCSVGRSLVSMLGPPPVPIKLVSLED